MRKEGSIARQENTAVSAPDKPKVNIPKTQEKQKPEVPLRFSKMHALTTFTLGAILSLLTYIKLGRPSGDIYFLNSIKEVCT